jgi:hypothetical protein
MGNELSKEDVLLICSFMRALDSLNKELNRENIHEFFEIYSTLFQMVYETIYSLNDKQATQVLEMYEKQDKAAAKRQKDNMATKSMIKTKSGRD